MVFVMSLNYMVILIVLSLSLTLVKLYDSYRGTWNLIFLSPFQEFPNVTYYVTNYTTTATVPLNTHWVDCVSQ